MRIVDGTGTNVAKYRYDPYGNLVSSSGTMAAANPLRYRGYYYDTETGFYYLQSRYYDPKICRFINADNFASTGQGILGHNMFAYCGNNPIVFRDSSGYSVETALDVASALYSFFTLIGSPSWANAGYLLWDAASVIIPGIPGSYVATSFRVAGKLDEFVDSAEVLTGTYRQLKKLLKGTKNIEIHHLIEKRFSQLFSTSTDDFFSIALSPETHQLITNRWRNLHKVDDIFELFAYGSDYTKITYDQMVKAVKEVYHDMPAVLDNVLEWLSENWKG